MTKQGQSLVANNQCGSCHLLTRGDWTEFDLYSILSTQKTLWGSKVGNLVFGQWPQFTGSIVQIDLGSLIAKLDSSVDGLIVKLGSIDIPTDVIANKASSAFDPLDQAVVHDDELLVGFEHVEGVFGVIRDKFHLRLDLLVAPSGRDNVLDVPLR